jgi:hypothetical protein
MPVLLELFHEPFHDAAVEVVAAEVGVAVGGLDLEDAFAEFQDGDIEGAAARSYTAMVFSFFWSLLKPKANEAAVGSLMMRLTSRPAILPASLVLALRVVEVGGHRMTASVTGSPR